MKKREAWYVIDKINKRNSKVMNESVKLEEERSLREEEVWQKRRLQQEFSQVIILKEHLLKQKFRGR